LNRDVAQAEQVQRQFFIVSNNTGQLKGFGIQHLGFIEIAPQVGKMCKVVQGHAR
jgi:hypothetical protein